MDSCALTLFYHLCVTRKRTGLCHKCDVISINQTTEKMQKEQENVRLTHEDVSFASVIKKPTTFFVVYNFGQ